MTSAPSAFRCRTIARSESGEGRVSLIGCSDVRMRGPGMTPRATASRRSRSSGPPTLWIVVTPAISVAYRLPARASAARAGESPSSGRCSAPAPLMYQPGCTCTSMRPGSSVTVPSSWVAADRGRPGGSASTRSMRAPRTVTSASRRLPPRPSSSRAAWIVTTDVVSCAAARTAPRVRSAAARSACARRSEGMAGMRSGWRVAIGGLATCADDASPHNRTRVGTSAPSV